MTRLPRLRSLEVLHLPEEDGASYLLRDPEGFTDEELILSEAALFVAAHCDGEHDQVQLRDAFDRRYGKAPKPEDVARLIQRLDEAGMLETEAFQARRRELYRTFLAAPTRPAAHAGVSYPDDPDEARRSVRGFYESAAELEEEGPRPEGRLRGLVAPHIDLRVGGPCTALAHRLLAEASDVRTVVVLGTSHACPRPAWIVSRKPYETPLGPVPVDEDAAAGLARAAGTSDEDQFFHRKEHSVEFQALFLAGLRGEGRDLRMVPVLCGALPHDPGGADPFAEASDPFLDALRELLEAGDGRTVVLAAADLAHVGPRFGDGGALNTEGLAFLEGDDRRTLETVVQVDRGGFYRAVTAEGDPRRICGLSPIYGLLAAVPGAKGKVLRYEQANDPTGTVTYASVGLWG